MQDPRPKKMSKLQYLNFDTGPRKRALKHNAPVKFNRPLIYTYFKIMI